MRGKLVTERMKRGIKGGKKCSQAATIRRHRMKEKNEKGIKSSERLLELVFFIPPRSLLGLPTRTCFSISPPVEAPSDALHLSFPLLGHCGSVKPSLWFYKPKRRSKSSWPQVYLLKIYISKRWMDPLTFI